MIDRMIIDILERFIGKSIKLLIEFDKLDFGVLCLEVKI